MRYSLFPRKGGNPVCSQNANPPRLKISLLKSLALFRRHSGAMKLGVPTKCSNIFFPGLPVPDPCTESSKASRDVPKSQNFIDLSFRTTRMFSGLMSLWIIPVMFKNNQNLCCNVMQDLQICSSYLAHEYSQQLE